MIKVFRLFVFGALSLSILGACSSDKTREDKTAAIIGAIDSPFLVVSMTPQNLMDKSGILDGILPFTYELVLEFFIDEKVTGIDYSVKSQLVVGKGESFEPSIYGIFKIKDEKKFGDLIEKEANAEIVEKDGMQTAVKESDRYAVVWNEEFAIISNIPMDFSAMFTGGGGGDGDKVVTKLIALINAAEDGEPDPTYAEFLKKDADISIYYDGKGMYGYMESMMMDKTEDIQKMKDTYEGISSEIYFNFNDGSIDIEFINHISDELRAKMDVMADKGISGKLLSYGNSSNPIMIGGYNLDLIKLFDYLETQLDERDYNEMEEDFAEFGLTVDEFKSSMTGEVIYMIDRVVAVEETIDYGYGEPYTHTSQTPMFALIASVSNPSVVQKLLADSLKLPNGSYQMGDAYLVLDGDVLFATNDSSWSNKVITKSTTKITKGADVIAANPFAMYVDFSSLAQMKDLDDVAAYVTLFTEFSGGANLDGGKFSFKLKDASKNSLRVITETIANELSRLEKQGNELLEEELEDAALEGLDELEELEELEKNLEALEEQIPK